MHYWKYSKSRIYVNIFAKIRFDIQVRIQQRHYNHESENVVCFEDMLMRQGIPRIEHLNKQVKQLYGIASQVRAKLETGVPMIILDW